MPVTPLDLIVIGVVLISALLAMVRGFTREVLAIGAWVAAALAGLLLFPYLLPYVRPYIKHETFAQLASGGIIFFVTLILVSFITIRISDMILDSRIGAIDRALGFVFGAARGLLLMVVAYMFFSSLVQDDKQPWWVKEAKSRELLASGSNWMFSILPSDPNNPMLKIFKFNDPAQPTTPNPDADPSAPSNEPGEPAEPAQ